MMSSQSDNKSVLILKRISFKSLILTSYGMKAKLTGSWIGKI
ncbi:hypothetical protein [Arsenophonus nasoniae]